MSDSPLLCSIMNHPDIHQIDKLTPHPEISTIPLAFSATTLCGLKQEHMPLFTFTLDHKPTCPECLRKLPRLEHPPGGFVNGGHGIPKTLFDTNVPEVKEPTKTIFHENWSKDRNEK